MPQLFTGQPFEYRIVVFKGLTIWEASYHAEKIKEEFPMLSPFVTFLLVFAAFVGTVLFVANPLRKVNKSINGKKVSELSKKLDDKIENEPVNTLLQGCGITILMFINLLYCIFIEPVFVITALIKDIGYQPIGLAMLVIIGINWISMITVLVKSKKKNGAKVAVETTNGEKVEGILIEDPEVKVKVTFWGHLKKFFFFLPDLYLWYIFLVVIHVIK